MFNSLCLFIYLNFTIIVFVDIRIKRRMLKYLAKHHFKCETRVHNRSRSTPNILIKSLHSNFIIDGDSNACPTCHNFQDIRNRNAQDLDLLSGSRSNLNVLIVGQHAISYLTAILMFAIFVTISETVEMCMTLTMAFRMVYGQM